MDHIDSMISESKRECTVELTKLCEPIARYIQHHFHPHTTVVIECDRIRVEESLAEELIEYEID